ncbi:MAG: alanine racemase [Acidobacteria bacterium]|nr:alanine racemase [Acidobacteriota bacterium]
MSVVRSQWYFLLVQPTTDHQLPITSSRPTWAEISLPNLIHNYLTIKSHLHGEAQLMAVVKANAYGHGAVACARALEREANADWFGVALIEEGVELREAGITRPILCLGGFWHGQAGTIIAHDLTPVIYRLDQAEELNAQAQQANRVVNYHLKVDTGMGRLGVPLAELPAFAQAIKRCANITLDGQMTHFAEAEAIDQEFTRTQLRGFNEALSIVQAAGFAPTWKHLSNSAGIHSHPNAWGNLARAGAAMYGFTRDVLAEVPEAFATKPVLSLHSRIVHLKTVPAGTPLGYGRTFTTTRTSRIATLPIGYADGFHRAHSNNGHVIVRGQFAPIVGRVSMDLTMLDVTDVAAVELGEEVILLGTQGSLQITAEDIAARIGTISYEVACSLSARVPRVVLDSR